MWDRKGALVFEYIPNSFTNPYLKHMEIVLDKGERIVGIKSHNDWPEASYHQAFQFVISKME